MTYLDDIRQKANGQIQQVKGEYKQRSGDRVGGGWDKFRGDINEGIADLKMRMRGEEEDDDEEGRQD